MACDTYRLSSPTLLGLPAEIRLKIYGYVLPELELIERMTEDSTAHAVVQDCRNQDRHVTSRYEISPFLPIGIQLVCKKLNEEMESVVQGCPIKYVLKQTCSCHNWHGPPARFCNRVRTVTVPGYYRRKPIQETWLSKTRDLFPNLKIAELAYSRWDAYEVNIRAGAATSDVLRLLDDGWGNSLQHELSVLETTLKDTMNEDGPTRELVTFIQANKLTLKLPFTVWVPPSRSRSVEYYMVAIGV